MAKRRERKAAAATDPADIPLRQPDRSGPSKETLLKLAGGRSLFEQADIRQRELNKSRGIVQPEKEKDVNGDGDDDEDEDDDDSAARAATDAALPPRAERILDTLLWSVSLATLHFTLDVLVQNQYAVAIEWPEVVARALRALAVLALLFYNLHRHPSDPRLLPGLPARFQHPLRQTVFFVAGTVTGCYLVHITNNYGYIAVMQQAPPIGCLWVWSVIELDLVWAVVSLAVTGGFLKVKGYGL
ncbi:hypothetical protein SPI_03706 [Niveomyces insectorum RCEF 264]|uniref:DUF7719 domain-containing protein n=1 Tax=Niveomyces insectorum RCEF 264 TaxID=1081102 RepID=A0A167WAJ1_9HYPO|nr:hypothetical protein SPI_03706 [Niveomyces insectorum RCEF 264]